MAFAAAAPVIGSVVSGLFAKSGQAKANEANTAMAREQMAFQERMSSTAHQREVKDLLAAGLNPILSGTGGAGSSTPSGAMPNIQSENEGFGGLGQAASSAIQAMNMRQELKNAQKTWELLESQRRKTSNEADIAGRESVIRGVEQKIAENFGENSAEAALKLRQAQVPEAEASAELWKDLGSGGEIAKGLGSAAPLIKMLMQVFGRK